MKYNRQKVQNRILRSTLIFLGLFGIVILRYAWIQIVDGDAMARRMDSLVNQDVKIESPRGRILDRTGRELAVSTMTKSLYVDPNHVKDADTLAADLAPLIGLSEEDIQQKIAIGGGFVWLKRRMPQEEYEAVREGIYNALIHNVYMTGTPIQIRIDEHTMEISNSCILPEGWTAESMMSPHKSMPYNPTIAKVFYRMGYIENWGRGIQKIVAESGAKVDIDDDGTIHIASPDAASCDLAKKFIDEIVFVPEVGQLYYGRVVSYLTSKQNGAQLGAFIELAPGKDGLCHISKVADRRVEKVEDVLKIGDMTWVKVVEIDEKGRVNLSRKDALKEIAEKEKNGEIIK